MSLVTGASVCNVMFISFLLVVIRMEAFGNPLAVYNVTKCVYIFPLGVTLTDMDAVALDGNMDDFSGALTYSTLPPT